MWLTKVSGPDSLPIWFLPDVPRDAADDRPVRPGSAPTAHPGRPLVGMTGFEPATFRSQSGRATNLRHIPDTDGRAYPARGVSGDIPYPLARAALGCSTPAGPCRTSFIARVSLNGRASAFQAGGASSISSPAQRTEGHPRFRGGPQSSPV